MNIIDSVVVQICTHFLTLLTFTRTTCGHSKRVSNEDSNVRVSRIIMEQTPCVCVRTAGHTPKHTLKDIARWFDPRELYTAAMSCERTHHTKDSDAPKPADKSDEPRVYWKYC